jgi:hypothetical protein
MKSATHRYPHFLLDAGCQPMRATMDKPGSGTCHPGELCAEIWCYPPLCVKAWHGGQISVNVRTCKFVLAFTLAIALAGRPEPALRLAACRGCDLFSCPAQGPGQGRARRRRHDPAGPTPAGREHPARPATPAQGPAVLGLRHLRLVEQARQPGHRPRRDHRDHPASRPRHPQPRARWLRQHRHRRTRPYGGSEQSP